MFRIGSVTIARTEAATKAARVLQEHFPHPEWAEEPPFEPDHQQGKRALHLARKRGKALGLCASLHDEYLCCGVHVLKSVSNCPFQCSYCVLQDYLNNGTLQVVADTPALLEEVRTRILEQPWRLFRIGTWVLGDSLALESLTGSAAELVHGFAELPNAVLELKTKSNNVDSLLSIPHPGKTVISWSLNPPSVIEREEHGTATLDRRLQAMRKVVDAGYPVAVHFDPMVLFDGWESEYATTVQRLFEMIPAHRIAWLSIGSLRFNPSMKLTMEENFPESRLTAAELVLGGDGKLRYVKPLRLRLYRHLWAEIRKHAGETPPYTYFCMERPDVWRRVLGFAPSGIAEHDYLFAESLHRHFPELAPLPPDRSRYLALSYE